ncbi:MAG: helix-hairpin-helix domain-containing protein, partial [Acutalibacteraceae bacterium]
MDILAKLAAEFSLRSGQVENTVKLIDDGNTIPFIARYRKEMTGSLDDQVLRELYERLIYLRGLDEQREKIRASITEQDKMTDEIERALDSAATMTELEDIYRPFRPKRKTRATVAKAKGLEPLATAILNNTENGKALDELAAEYINEDLGVQNTEEALAGASDIIAEIISDDPSVRKRLRIVAMSGAFLTSKATGEELGVYEMYKDFSEKVGKIAGHRVLAVNRGEKEGFLKVGIEFDRLKAVGIIGSAYLNEGNPYNEFVSSAAEDSYDRLIFPSLEREIRNEITEKASDSAIKVFSLNLKQLLMQPPVKGKVTLGLDPGYRTGCKVAVVDATGKVLDTGVIYPVPPHNKVEEAKKTITGLCRKHGVSVIAIGNGTASHETEVFAAELIKEIGGIKYMVVSEAGASVYSASKLAAAEFPEYDVSLRSAVSIARRLEDPLAELVKIDPQAIGVGQYQHDMPKAKLSEALSGVVESCVNTVGVDLNTASVPLLARVSGLSESVAKNIVRYRDENGEFSSRAELKKVPKLGPKAYEQCAGFLRITGGKNILDSTAVHPESYDAAKKLLVRFGYKDSDVKNNAVRGISEKIAELGAE